MPTTICPTCGEALPKSARYCDTCGKNLSREEITLRLKRPSARLSSAVWNTAHRSFVAERETLQLKPGDVDPTLKLAHKELAWVEGQEGTDEATEEDLEDGERRGTWQKVVTGTPRALPADELERKPARRPAFPPLPVLSRSRRWIGLMIVIVLLLSGVFELVRSFGHGATPPVVQQPTLQVAPATVALGGIITVRGSHFGPDSTLTLSRDQQISLLDTGNASDIQVDTRGIFSDTVIVDPKWLPGKHTLYATDTPTHQRAAFSITVTGQSALQGPPHLLLSASSLDFGTGDEASNDSKLLALSNGGGGQLIWQASSGQSWLQISPTSGAIPSGDHTSLTVALDRATLKPGIYTTNIVFASNTEQVTLPVSMSVIPLQPQHQAVLQLSPALLTFNAAARGPDPQSQTFTVSNPGVQPLNWGVSVTFQNNRGNWLRISSQGGSIAPGSQQQILVSASIRGLAPGVYKGALLFSNQGPKPIQGSPKSVSVSLSVAPPCTLAFAPGSLSFTGIHGQASPAPQSLQINVAQGCATSQQWSASSSTNGGGNWLGMGQSSGSTPAQPQVNVNTSGLAPGTYTGALTFATRAGQQIVSVTLNVNPVACVISAPGSLTLQGTAGQSTQSTQNANLSTSGDCSHPLNWTSAVSVSTPSGGTWLSATSSGSFTPPASANVTVQANLTGLSAGTYNGSVSISAVDGATNQSAGTVQIPITLTVQPQCTAQAVSPSTLPFNASVGSNPSPNTATFTISVSGNCAGNVTITPSVDTNDSNWLAVSGPVTLASGNTATFTVTITSGALTAGTYNGTITLSSGDGNGTIAGSPQTVHVTLTVQ